MIRLCFQGDISSLEAGIRELTAPYSFAMCDDCGMPVAVKQQDGGRLSVRIADGGAEIVYDKKIHFFRALGLLLEHQAEPVFFTEETEQFTMNGPMFDVSQGNAVINVSAARDIIRRMAVMGLNTIMMYCEDSYDVPAQPYFGYMRSRYSEEEIRALDAYADQFGIEMIPCIQTLAHLVDTLKWDVFDEIREDKGCLLVGEEKTYRFVRDLLEAATRPFQTKRVHIGMDEAWGLGRGRYQDLHGVVPKTEIMLQHLNRVMEIVRELGLRPMMWSDMFFRAVLPDGDYYNENAQFTEEIKKAVPPDVQLVYWDYYHDDKEDFYQAFIDKHREFGEPVFAGGIWTWVGFGANYPKTFRTTNPALMACKRKGVKEVFATVWGDNGTECSVQATLLGLSLFAEHGYAFELDEEKLKKRFEFCCGTRYEDFLNLRFLDETPGVPADNLDACNPSKFLMWQDIMGGLFDRNIEGLPMDRHYAALAEKLLPAAEANGDYNELFRYNYRVADVLAKKAEMGLRITAAYKAGDRTALRRFAEEELPELERRVRALRSTHREHWFHIYKPFGWDIMDMRYGSLLARIDSAAEEIRMYLDGRLEKLEELEETRRLYNGREGVIRYANFYSEIVSSSQIAPHG